MEPASDASGTSAGGAVLSQQTADPSVSPAISPAGEGSRAFDFRRPRKLAPEQLSSLESLHETFSRRLAVALGHQLRTTVTLAPVSIDEMSYEGYVRSLPNPSVMALVGLDPLPGHAILETSAPIGLVLVERMLGGPGTPGLLRRPTDLETRLLAEVLGHALDAFRECFAPLVDVSPALAALETNPSFVQGTPGGETTVLLTYTIQVGSSAHAEGLLSVCYPLSTLQPLMERLGRVEPQVQEPAADAALPGLLREVEEASVVVSVTLRPTRINAGDLAALRPGDVLRCDHAVSEPVIGCVQGAEIMQGFVGRRGRRLGFRFSDWR